MKRIIGIAMVLGLVGALTVMAQEVKPGKVDVIDLGKDVKLEMVLVPAGKFVMGSLESEKGRSKDETQHEVILTKPFYMGKYEVTQEQWEAVMVNNRSFYRGPKLPVTSVSWKDCQEFIKKLNEKKVVVIGCQQRQNGNMHVGREQQQRIRLGIRSHPRMQTIGIRR